MDPTGQLNEYTGRLTVKVDGPGQNWTVMSGLYGQVKWTVLVHFFLFRPVSTLPHKDLPHSGVKSGPCTFRRDTKLLVATRN